MEKQVEYLRRIFALLDDGIILLDREGAIVYSNSAADNILGFEFQKMIGKGFLKLLTTNNIGQRFAGFVEDALQKNAINKHSLIAYQKDKHSTQDLLVKAKPMTFDPGINQERTFTLIVIRDATQMMDYHRRLLAEKLDGMERVARAVAHSIRNPVTSIGGLANHLLERHNINNNDKQFLRHIVAASQRLEQIVSSVREYTDLPDIKAEAIDLQELLSSIVDKINARAKQQNVKVTYDYFTKTTSDTFVLRADSILLRKMFVILVDNALDAVQQGGDLTIKLIAISDEFVVRISDDGNGISAEDIPFLFDPLFTTKANAVGMNLAIALRIVREHHGTINVESIPSEGTTFKIEFPIDGPNSMWPRSPSSAG